MRTVNRKFFLLILLIGIFIAAVGDAFASIAFTLQAAAMNRPDLLAAVLLADLIPGIFFGLLGGTLADRKLRWWWWPCALVAQAGMYATMALSLQWHVIVAGVAVVSGLNALVGPVSKKLVAFYADDVRRVGALLALISGTAQAVGLVLGGFAMGLGAIALLLWSTTLALACFAFISLWVSTPQAIRLDTSSQKGTLGGFKLLASSRFFGSAGLILLVGVILSTSFEGVVNVFVLTREAGFTAGEFAASGASWALAMIAGSLSAPRIRIDGFRGFPGAGVGIGAPIALVGLLLPPLWAVIPLYLLGGFSNGVFNSLINRVILTAPDYVQGRIWAAFHWIVNLCFLLGYTSGGILGAHHSQLIMILAGCSVLALVTACSLFRAGRRRRAGPNYF